MVAHFDRSDIDRRVQLAFPIFDVRVCTYDAGLLVIGIQIDADSAERIIREHRQAWYCVPVQG
jgi:hypothetical protein